MSPAASPLHLLGRAASRGCPAPSFCIAADSANTGFATSPRPTPTPCRSGSELNYALGTRLELEVFPAGSTDANSRVWNQVVTIPAAGSTATATATGLAQRSYDVKVTLSTPNGDVTQLVSDLFVGERRAGCRAAEGHARAPRCAAR